MGLVKITVALSAEPVVGELVLTSGPAIGIVDGGLPCRFVESIQQVEPSVISLSVVHQVLC